MAYHICKLNGSSLILTTSKKGLYNFSLFENLELIERANTKNPLDLVPLLSDNCNVSCPDTFSANLLSKSNPVILLPQAKLIGHYLAGEKQIMTIDIKSIES